MSFTIDRVARVANNLRTNLSQDSLILTDPTDPGFQESMKRWSSIDLQIPSAIIKPSCEEDIVKIVASATKEDIPFVAKAGGNSPWSTIGPGGWIIDLSLFQEIKVDVEKQTATFSAAVIAKDINEAVSKAGFIIQSAAFSRIGQIPFLLGGGSSALSGKYGIGSDNVLCFRVVTATRGLVVASEAENADLFWALKGAGQFFGIVTQATMRIFPLEHSVTQWVCIFPPTQVKEVAAAIEAHANGPNSMLSSGFAGITAAPGQSKPIVLVSTSHFRPASEVDEIMAPFLALKPLQNFRKTIDFGNVTDSAESHNKQGGLKTHISCGMQRWESEKFVAGLDAWNKLVDEHPDAKGSVFMCNWISTEGMRDGESAWSHRDCVAWPMWFTPDVDETTAQACVRASEAHISFCQKDQMEDEKALFPNHSRVLSLAQRYRGKERQEKLRSLKELWDPEGIFTRQFL